MHVDSAQMSRWSKASNVFLGTIVAGCAIVVAQPSFNVNKVLSVYLTDGAVC